MPSASDLLLQGFDWRRTPLGDRGDWPAEMCAVIQAVMASDFPMCTVWGAQHIQIYNDAYYAIYGVKHPASFGAPARESWPEIWEFLGPAMDQVMVGGETLWFKKTLLPLVRLRRPEERYFDFSYSPIRAAGGTIAGALSVVTERTEQVVMRRRQSLRRLDVARGQEDVYRALPQALHDALLDNETDCAAAVLYSVDAGTEAPDGVVWSLMADQEFVRGIRPLAARALRRRSISSGEIDFPNAETASDGPQAACIPIHGRAGEARWALVILPSDLVPFRRSFLPLAEAISERVHAVLHAAELRLNEVGQMREQMAEQALVYRFLFDNIQDGVAYCATTGAPGDDEMVLAVNPRLCEMLGYSADELIGMSRDVALSPGDGALKAALEQRDREHRFTGELQLRKKTGQMFPAELSSNLIEFRKGQRRSLTLIRDISHRRQAEEERAERVRLETVANLAGSLAHDTNNLMTIVIGSTEFLSESLPEGGTQRRMALNAMAAAERASGLTNQLLIYARRQPPAVRPIDMNAFLDEVRPLIASALGETSKLNIRCHENLPPCLADPTQLTTALLNLVTNARHAMPDGGVLEIETFDLENGASRDCSSAPLTVPRVGLRVKDNGIGIPPEIRERIFEPFFTTKEVGNGSGLGLSIVRRLMDELGGTLKMNSAPGQGTVFELGFRTAAVPLGGEDDETPEARAGGELVLYVEDNETVRCQTQVMLQQIGFQPRAFETAREALEWLRSGGEPDLLLTDLVLPSGISGLELAAAVHRERPALPVVITTGHDPRAALAEERDRHFPVLRKPYTRRALGDMLMQELPVHASDEGALRTCQG